LLAVTTALVMPATRDSEASVFVFCRFPQGCDGGGCGGPQVVAGDAEWSEAPGGTWYWLRSPDEETRVVMGLYNRYCIRCHGVDGRGIWDIPNVPDFTNARWQASRSNGQLARAILEGRGAVMPPFRGTLTLEEAWGVARYLGTFVPGTEASRPDLGQTEKPGAPGQAPAPKKQGEPLK
jgi:mono/diheme cytochrome c family protein